jgi:hypothetical protein
MDSVDATGREVTIRTVSGNSRIDQQRFDLFRGCVLHVRKHVRIHIGCKGNAGVAEFADDFGETPAANEIVAAVWRTS